MGKDFWNNRYNVEGFIFGTEPNHFVEKNAHLLKPNSKVLFPADGEGRNSSYVASLGHQVIATDFSDVALEKSRQLAQKNNINVEYQLMDIFNWQPQADEYDAIIAIFMQFAPPEERSKIFKNFITALKPNGLLFLHGYNPKQLEYKTGGPKAIENFYTKELLRHDFAQLDIIELEEYDTTISEGNGHNGKSALIDFIARKEDY